MSDEAAAWLRYARENRLVAVLAMENGLFNASLQNAQQAVEKSLKAICLSRELGIKKTHSIRELWNAAREVGTDAGLMDEDCDLLDSIYVPSKYPMESVLPDYAPDRTVAQRCLSMVNKVLVSAEEIFGRL